jgi:hypothetical protein
MRCNPTARTPRRGTSREVLEWKKVIFMREGRSDTGIVTGVAPFGYS